MKTNFDDAKFVAVTEFATNNSDRHSSAGNGSCYINTGWPNTFQFTRRAIARLIKTADEKQLNQLKKMLELQIKNLNKEMS